MRQLLLGLALAARVVREELPLGNGVAALQVRGVPAAPRAHLRMRAPLEDARPPAAVAPSGSDLTRIEVPAGGGTGTFADLVATPRVAENLAAQNVTAPNALQSAAFAPIAAGRDVILNAWTGSGKTLAFLLPLLERLDPAERAPQVLVLSPSRELAFQIARVAEAAVQGTGLHAVAIVGGANPNRQLDKVKQLRPQIIVGTPGRVAELAFEWRKLKLQRIRHVVLDEVDAALRPPHLDAMLELVDSMRDGRPLQLVFASATADTPAVRRVAAQLQHDPLLLQLTPEAGAAAQLPASITHGLWTVPPKKALESVKALYNTKPSPTALVFVNSPHRARFVAQKLWESYGVPAAPLYGEQEREERVDVMRRLADGRVRFAVTTEMGARGLDLPLLTHVVNLELPTDAAHYVHRAGRCGRLGQAEGTVISVVPREKAFVVEKLAKELGVPLEGMHIREGKVQLGTAPRPKRTAPRKRKRARNPTMRQRSPARSPDGEYRILDRGEMKLAKDCAQCGKVMTWRKKWEKNWDSVKYCSERCRREAKRDARNATNE